MDITSVLLHADDDVVNLLADAAPGDTVVVRDSDERLIAREFIPMGHKLARRTLAAGSPLRKYGEPIGTLTADVASGAHVHVHNLRSGPPIEAKNSSSRFDADALRAFGIAVATHAGVSASAAVEMTEVMLEADLRGVDTHGLRRLAPYLERIRSHAVDGAAEPVIVRRASIIDVDARNAIGHYAMMRACQAIVAGAREQPVQVATIRESNHFGLAGYYVSWLAQRGFVAICASNGTPCVAPPGGRVPFFSNDPLAIAAADGEITVEYDVALSSVSRARIAQSAERGNSIPSDWALDEAGIPTTDAAAALRGTLLPFGGERGFGLLFAVEILAGVLGGGAFADDVASKEQAGTIERTSHVLIAIASGALHDGHGFGQRLRALVERMREVSRDASIAPRYPGERRWELRRHRLKHGVPLDTATVRALKRVADSAAIAMPPELV